MSNYPKKLYGRGTYTVVKSPCEEIDAKQRGFFDPNEKTETVQKNHSDFGNVELSEIVKPGDTIGVPEIGDVKVESIQDGEVVGEVIKKKRGRKPKAE